MRITENTRFPHPVLGLDSGDFVAGEFSIQIQVKEDRSAGTVTLEHAITLTEPAIRALVESNQASVGCIIKCADTFFSDLKKMTWSTGITDFPPDQLLNQVTFRPIVWLKKDLDNWDPGTINSEFSPPISLKKSDIIAIGNELMISVGQAKLTPIESIFELVKSERIPDGELQVDISGSCIGLLVSEKTFQTLSELRLQSHSKDILMSSIYLPAVMEVLDILRNDSKEYELQRWYQPFLAKCHAKGIDIESNHSILEAAQCLLEHPISHLGKIAEE